jgi:hypothetical protein
MPCRYVRRDRDRLIALYEQVPPAQNGFMKTLALLVCACFLALTVTQYARAETEADVARYGPYPTNYKEIVSKWLETQLIDPTSARIEWIDEPKSADLGTKGEHLYGYLVHFRVNARNRFGAYTGKQTHGALIRNGEVIKGLGFGY